MLQPSKKTLTPITNQVLVSAFLCEYASSVVRVNHHIPSKWQFKMDLVIFYLMFLQFVLSCFRPMLLNFPEIHTECSKITLKIHHTRPAGSSLGYCQSSAALATMTNKTGISCFELSYLLFAKRVVCKTCPHILLYLKQKELVNEREGRRICAWTTTTSVSKKCYRHLTSVVKRHY